MTSPAIDPRVLLQHAGYVRALAREVVFDADLARDVEQETWLAALQHAPRDLRAPRAWLAKLVRNVARRSWSRAAERAAREAGVARERAPASGVAPPDEFLEREQALRSVIAAVRRLPEPQRTAIALHYLDQLPLREVARRTEAPIETVRSRVKRGLELLRADLERSRGDAWSVAFVGALALDPPNLLRVCARLAREPVLLVTTMSSSTKILSAAAVLALVLLAGWIGLSRTGSTLPFDAAGEPPREPLAESSAVPDEPSPTGLTPPARVSAVPISQAPRATTGSLRASLVWADDQTPAVDVPVRVDLAPTRRGEAERLRLRSSGAGEIVLLDLVPGTLVLQPLFGGLAAAQVVAGETTELRLEIPNGIRVTGIVRDAEEVPVADADVFLDGGAMESQYEGANVARSDARGRFELRTVPAQVGASLSARAAGRGPTARVALTGAPRSAVEVVLVFEREGRALEGRVVDSAGRPVAGARVLVGSEREIVLEPRPDGTLTSKPIGELLTTGADGRFAVAGAPLAAVPVQARAPGFAPWRGECDTRTTGWIEVRLETGASVAGVVRGRDGAALAGARVRATGTTWFARAETAADAQGAYELGDLAGGSIEFEAVEPTRGRAASTLSLRAGARATWDPVLGAGPELAGRVEASGEDLAGWRVRAYGEGSERAYHEETTTDAAGRFSLHACPEGEFGLALFGRGGTAVPVARLSGVRAGGPEVVLRPDPELAPSASIVGRLVDERGVPVRNADVRATHASGGFTLVHPDPERGTFQLARLPAGEWAIEVDAFTAGWAIERVTHTLAPGETWDAGAILLGSGGTLRLSLGYPPDVAPIPRVAVVRDAEGRIAQWIPVAALEARSRPLAPGTYRVVLPGDDGSGETSREFAVVAGQETRVEMVLPAPASPQESPPR